MIEGSDTRRASQPIVPHVLILNVRIGQCPPAWRARGRCCRTRMPWPSHYFAGARQIKPRRETYASGKSW